MSVSKIFRPRVLLAIGSILILAVVAFGYAAANVVPESGAGDGTGTVSGYTITNVDYTLDATDPSTLASVEFDVGPTSGAGAATDVRITVDGGTTWITCVAGTPPAWTCTFTVKPSVSAISNLQVVAAE